MKTGLTICLEKLYHYLYLLDPCLVVGFNFQRQPQDLAGQCHALTLTRLYFLAVAASLASPIIARLVFFSATCEGGHTPDLLGVSAHVTSRATVPFAGAS